MPRLLFTRTPRSLSAGLLPRLYQFKGLFLSEFSIRHLFLQNSIMFHSCSLPRSPWMVALPSKVSPILLPQDDSGSCQLQTSGVYIHSITFQITDKVLIRLIPGSTHVVLHSTQLEYDVPLSIIFQE